MFPFEYAEVRIDEVLDRIDMAEDQLADILNQYTNWELFEQDNTRPWWPVLKC
jgi:hypothetical protein